MSVKKKMIYFHQLLRMFSLRVREKLCKASLVLILLSHLHIVMVESLELKRLLDDTGGGHCHTLNAHT